MKHIRKERDRLLRGSARFFGLAATSVVILCLLVPGALEPALYPTVLALLVALGFSQYRLGSTGEMIWIVAILVTGLATLIVVNLFTSSTLNRSLYSAMAALLGGSLACVGVVLSLDLRRFAFGLFMFLVTQAVVIVTSPPVAAIGYLIVSTAGWLTAAVVGWWLSASVPRVMRRITSIGRAHQAERQASETEAQRRQGARLLHDTVLATLTLLAHSGVGVSPDALRQQAADDARLLRQLRTGDMAPTASMVDLSASAGTSVDYQIGSGDDAPGTTLESVKQRFHRIGLTVSWHGTGQVLLPNDILDSFLLALAECLENVRRHSGVTDAHVTITDDEVTVRAMVTDAGIGFDLGNVDQAKLGFKESVVARLREVGGNARLFSSPGSGTTVVLEVPK